MKYPNFFIVGFPKSGTTALYYFLKQHNQIFMPKIKEPHYFCTDFHKEADQFYRREKSILNSAKRFKYRQKEDYLKLFSKVNGEKAVGEASVHYLYSDVAAQHIHAFNPEAKIIISLRNPIEFIRSWYQWNKFDLLAEGAENIREALELEKHRKRGAKLKVKKPPVSHLCYKQMAKYYNHVAKFLDYFPNNNIKIVLFDHFIESNKKICEEIYYFLGVNPDFEPDLETVNKSSIPRHVMLRHILDLDYTKKARNFFRTYMPENILKLSKSIYNTLIYKSDSKINFPEKIEKDLKQDLKKSITKLNKLLHSEKLISPQTNMVQLWDF